MRIFGQKVAAFLWSSVLQEILQNPKSRESRESFLAKLNSALQSRKAESRKSRESCVNPEAEKYRQRTI